MGERDLSMVDVKHMALVVLIDDQGQCRVQSGMGYSYRQQAAMLQMLADRAREKADELGEDLLTPEHQPARGFGWW